MPVNIRPLTRDNDRILETIRSNATLDYQRRVPNATKASVRATLEHLTTHRAHWNEFIDALVNRIGSVVTRNIVWSNPLAQFKRGMLTYGDTIEEVQVGLVKAHTYDRSRDYLERDIFGIERPDVQSNFHTVNRENFYKVSISEPELRKAFLAEGGLSQFVSQLMAAPATSDQWDEFLLTTSLFSEYERAGGFFHVHSEDVRSADSTSVEARSLLRQLRAYASTLTFPSTKYNAAHMPTFAAPEDMVLFVTPETKAALDVEALAAAFNTEYTNVFNQIVEIPEEQFGLPGVQAILAHRDFFVIADTVLENTSQPNPVGLSTNYFLHHWEVVSASRFVPAVLFHTGASDEVINIPTPVKSVSAVTVTDKDGATVDAVKRGVSYNVAAEAITNPAGGDNSGVVFVLSGAESSKTTLTQNGTLYVGGDETSSSLKINAASVWIDPDNVKADPVHSADLTLTVTGDRVLEWPENGKIVSITVKGVSVNEPVAAGTLAYKVTGVKIDKASDVAVTTEDGADVKVTVKDGKATITVDGSPSSAPVVYTVTAV